MAKIVKTTCECGANLVYVNSLTLTLRGHLILGVECPLCERVHPLTVNENGEIILWKDEND